MKTAWLAGGWAVVGDWPAELSAAFNAAEEYLWESFTPGDYEEVDNSRAARKDDADEVGCYNHHKQFGHRAGYKQFDTELTVVLSGVQITLLYGFDYKSGESDTPS